MNIIEANPLLGIGWHAVGALFAATCYTPQKKIRNWSWQTYWLAQATFCWFLLPILGAWLTIPGLATVLREAPTAALARSGLVGLAYGIGGTAFGIAIRYIGFSLTYAIAVGLSAVLGTLIPPLVKGTLAATLSKTGADWIMAGIAVGAIGIGCAGFAGRRKEVDLAASDAATGDFSLAKGLALSLVAGVLSAVYGFALEAGEPIAEVASAHGAGIWRGNIVYIFANSGAFISTAVYCLFLHFRRATLGEYIQGASSGGGLNLGTNWTLAIATGLFWYGQFFFYNLGHVQMGHYKFTSWAIHMIMLVLISNLVGLGLREWFGCKRATLVIVGTALIILTVAVLLLTYGNYLGERNVL